MNDPKFWLQLASTLVVPITITILVLFFKPFIQQLLLRSQTVQIKGLEIGFELPEGEDKLTSGAPPALTSTARRIVKEGSKEQLEKLRVALETEQVHQMIQYHVNSLDQSRISFWFSIGSGALGFLVILMGGLLALTGVQTTSAVLSVASGAIIDAVAALFFTQSNQARRLMTEFFDKLRKDRQFNESLRLCESIEDREIQSTLKARLALFFAGIPIESVPSEHLTTYLKNPTGRSPA